MLAGLRKAGNGVGLLEGMTSCSLLGLEKGWEWGWFVGGDDKLLTFGT